MPTMPLRCAASHRPPLSPGRCIFLRVAARDAMMHAHAMPPPIAPRRRSIRAESRGFAKVAAISLLHHAQRCRCRRADSADY